MAWRKIKSFAKHCDVSERTVRYWLKEGLPHSRLPSGTILVEVEAGDAWLRKFGVEHSEKIIADALLKGM